MGLSDDMIQAIASEPDDTALERERLTTKLRVLKAGYDTLSGLDRRTIIGEQTEYTNHLPAKLTQDLDLPYVNDNAGQPNPEAAEDVGEESPLVDEKSEDLRSRVSYETPPRAVSPPQSVIEELLTPPIPAVEEIPLTEDDLGWGAVTKNTKNTKNKMKSTKVRWPVPTNLPEPSSRTSPSVEVGRPTKEPIWSFSSK